MRTFQFHLLRLCLFVAIMWIGGFIAIADNIFVMIGLAFLGSGLIDLYCENSFTFHMNPGDKVLLGKDKKYGIELSAMVTGESTLEAIVLKKQ